jgi:hypothetical protein
MQPTGTSFQITKGIPFFVSREDSCRDIPRYRLNDPEYGHVLQAKVLANTDVVLINPKKRTFYLAWRKAIPMNGWFWMGGNTGDINVSLPEGLLSVIKRETGFEMPLDRLTLRFGAEYFWKDRAQAPKDMACHMFGLTFSVDITEEEVAQIKLDPNEYEEGILREFTREDMVRESFFPVIIKAFDTIFPPEKLRHIVLISFKNSTPAAVRKDVYDRYQTLAEDCGGKEAGILSWRVAKNMDLRNGVHLVEVARFSDNDALQRFRAHPKHKEITDILCNVADWQVGDFMEMTD